MQDEIRECCKNIKRVQARDILYADQQRKPRNFQREDMVYLRVKSINSLRIETYTKLSPKFWQTLRDIEKVKRTETSKPCKDAPNIPCKLLSRFGYVNV